jgi:hypothetical protein
MFFELPNLLLLIKTNVHPLNQAGAQDNFSPGGGT